MSEKINEQAEKMREMAQTTLDKAKDAVSKYMAESQKLREKADAIGSILHHQFNIFIGPQIRFDLHQIAIERPCGLMASNFAPTDRGPVVRQPFLKLGKCFGSGRDDDRTEMGESMGARLSRGRLQCPCDTLGSPEPHRRDANCSEPKPLPLEIEIRTADETVRTQLHVAEFDIVGA